MLKITFESIFQQPSSLDLPASPLLWIACFTRPLLPGGNTSLTERLIRTKPEISTPLPQDFDNFEDCWGTKQEEFCKDEASTLTDMTAKATLHGFQKSLEIEHEVQFIR